MPRTFTADEVAAIAVGLAQCIEPIEPLNGSCVLCGRSTTCGDRPDDHERDCPWRQAKEYTETLAKTKPAKAETNRPPFETFKGAICKGCYALGSACGNCERCEWERNHAAQGTIRG